MEQKIEYAKYLGVKVFSNKYYSIHVMLFEHGMASVGSQPFSNITTAPIRCSGFVCLQKKTATSLNRLQSNT